MSKRIFLRPRRHSAELAVQLLFADNSDEEEQDPDDEDLDYIAEDMADGVEESIIVDETSHGVNETTEDIEEYQVSVTSTSTTKHWSAQNVLHPPDFHFVEVDPDYMSIPDEPGEAYIHLSKLDKLIAEVIIPESVRYSEQKGISFSTNVEEIKAFMAIMIFMGYHKLPAMRDYWSADPEMGIKFVQNLMTRKRFEALMQALHFVDNENADTKDKAYKVRSIIVHFNLTFQEYHPLTRNQSIDEHMVCFKGHNCMKQYMPKKPSIKWGFKVWMRSDAKTGYCFEFDLYTGRKPDGCEYALGESVVLQLSEKLNYTGVRLAFDNYFSSVRLMETLHSNGIKAVATVNSNKRNLPPIAKSAKKMKRGEISGSVEKDGKVAYCQWMDKRPVTMLSNFLKPCETTSVRRRVKGRSSKETVQKPVMVSELHVPVTVHKVWYMYMYIQSYLES